MPTNETKYTIEQDYKYQGDDWWKWWIWIEGDDIALNEIDHVTYTLHPTFINPVQKIKDRASKFRLSTEGWGVFMIHAKVVLKDSSEIPLKHYLELSYPDGTQNNE